MPSPGELPDPGIKQGSPALQADSLPVELHRKPSKTVNSESQTQEKTSLGDGRHVHWLPWLAPSCPLQDQDVGRDFCEAKPLLSKPTLCLLLSEEALNLLTGTNHHSPKTWSHESCPMEGDPF